LQAVVLAGGKGSRLRPYTAVLPKPLMPIGDYPILEVVIRQLKKFGFRTIILAVGHHSELFNAFFGNGEKWGVDIQYSFEDKPLGTAAPLRRISNLDETFLMMNGDILTDLRLDDLMEFHKAQGAMMTIAMHKRAVEIDYGTLECNDQGILLDYKEKPLLNYNVSMGIYILSRKVVSFIPEEGPFDFPDLVTALIKDSKKVVCYSKESYWLDIGRPNDYQIAIDDFEKMKEEFLE
jgi:NDP-sugar pyrophosphorylase family protein